MRLAVSLVGMGLWAAFGAAAQDKCPWMNAATAEGFLGGASQATVTPAACEFIRREGARETRLRIEVSAINAPHTSCGAGADALKGIGNEAWACGFEVKPGWTGEQVTGRVRDHAFVVRVRSNMPEAAAKAVREKARAAAEAVAGILF